MDISIVKGALNEIDSKYSSFILSTNIDYSDETSVSWCGYRSGILSNLAYAAEYQKLVDQRQYSFLLRDKSFFQFHFHWLDNEKFPRLARLAYYPTPLKVSGALDHLLEAAEKSGVDLLEEMYFGAESWLGRGIDVVNTSHLRMDYDDRVTSHDVCHVQFGGINQFRVSSKTLLNPLIFFSWICDSFEISGEVTPRALSRAIEFHKTKCPSVALSDSSTRPYLTF